jgi:hypothetical protein
MEPVRQTAMQYLKNRIHRRNGMERTMIQRSGESNLNLNLKFRSHLRAKQMGRANCRDTLDGVVIALR